MTTNHLSVYHSYESKLVDASFKRPGIFTRYVCSFLGWLLSNKMKKLIFISTLFAGIKNITEPSDRVLRKLNQLFRISGIDEAIGLPMVFGKALWSKKLPQSVFLEYQKRPVSSLCEIDKKVLSNAEKRVVANTIINRTPHWLIYGSRHTMRSDIVELFAVLPKIECKESITST